MSQRTCSVERDERSREIVMRRLACWRGPIDRFADPDVAIHGLRSRPGDYAAAIVGAVLPRMCGIECASDLRGITPGLPVFLATTPSIARYLNAQQEFPITMALSADALPGVLRSIVAIDGDVQDAVTPSAPPLKVLASIPPWRASIAGACRRVFAGVRRPPRASAA